jgi:hypothetical protein
MNLQPQPKWRGALILIKSERLELPAPFGRRIAKPLDADAAGQATFDGSLDQIGRKEGERYGHIDLPNAALFSDTHFLNRRHWTGDDIVEPLAAFVAPHPPNRFAWRRHAPPGILGWHLQYQQRVRGRSIQLMRSLPRHSGLGPTHNSDSGWPPWWRG